MRESKGKQILTKVASSRAALTLIGSRVPARTCEHASRLFFSCRHPRRRKPLNELNTRTQTHSFLSYFPNQRFTRRFVTHSASGFELSGRHRPEDLPAARCGVPCTILVAAARLKQCALRSIFCRGPIKSSSAYSVHCCATAKMGEK